MTFGVFFSISHFTENGNDKSDIKTGRDDVAHRSSENVYKQNLFNTTNYEYVADNEYNFPRKTCLKMKYLNGLLILVL